MNWLMYIGGAGVILIFWFHFIGWLFANTFNSEGKITLPIYYFIFPLMIWIWICVKFIR